MSLILFFRRKRDESFSSSRSLSRSRSLSPIRHRSPIRKSVKKHSPLGTVKYSHSNSGGRYKPYHSPCKRVRTNSKKSPVSSSSSYTSSSETH